MKRWIRIQTQIRIQTPKPMQDTLHTSDAKTELNYLDKNRGDKDSRDGVVLDGALVHEGEEGAEHRVHRHRLQHSAGA